MEPVVVVVVVAAAAAAAAVAVAVAVAAAAAVLFIHLFIYLLLLESCEAGLGSYVTARRAIIIINIVDWRNLALMTRIIFLSLVE